MGRVNMKDTDYYKSGKHRENYLKAAAKASATQQANKEKRITAYNANPTVCATCNTALEYSRRSNKFCSKSCSAIFNNNARNLAGWKQSEKQKTKASEVGKRNASRLNIKPPQKLFCNIYYISCRICNKISIVSSARKHRTTCQNEDCIVQAKVGERDYINGRRKPVWFFNPYENKEVLLDSSWEVVIAKLLIEKNIKWIRPSFIKWVDSNNKTRRYYPDFYLVDYGVYLDPKNIFGIKTGQEKINQVSKLINLVVGDLESIKSYVNNLSMA